MSGYKFSVPYNGDFETLEKIAENYGKGISGNEVDAVYFSPPPEIMGTGRHIRSLDNEHIKRIIDFCHEENYKASVALNSTCEGVDWYGKSFASKVIDFLREMIDYGLDSMIIANPLYIQMLDKEFEDVEIIASACSAIDSFEMASYYDELGADVLTPIDINRDLEVLKSIKEHTDLDLRLMVNEGCLWNCPFRIVHRNLTSHLSKGEGEDSLDFPSTACVIERMKDPSTYLKSEWIRPEDLHLYKDITKTFKIVGRTKDSEWINQVVGYYLKEEYDGNLLEILASTILKNLKIMGPKIENKDLDGFMEKVLNCDKNCYECNYCQEMAEKVIRYKRRKEIIGSIWPDRVWD